MQLHLLFFYATILLLPTQLGKHFFLHFSYLSGIRVDYLAPTVYLLDVIIFLLAIVNLKIVLKFFNNKMVLSGLFLLLINIIFSQLPEISFYWFIKIIEFLIIFSLSKKIIMTIKEKSILIILLLSGLFELFLSIIQFVSKHSVQGIFYYFGERLLTLSTPGVAKATMQGVEFLRPYGTFSHPNSLAGFFLLLYFFVLTFRPFNSFKILKLIFLLTAINYKYFAFVNQKLSFFRVHSDSISIASNDAKLVFHYDIAKAYFLENYYNDIKLIKKLNVLLYKHLSRYKGYSDKFTRIDNFYMHNRCFTVDFSYQLERFGIRLRKTLKKILR